MIRRSIVAVAAVIMLSAAAASTQAFADVETPDCTLLTTAFGAVPALAATGAAPHD